MAGPTKTRKGWDADCISKMCTSEQEAGAKRAKDSAVHLLLPIFYFPCSVSQPGSLSGVKWAFLLFFFFFLHLPSSEDRLCAHLGTVVLAFDVPQKNLNKGSKYSSKPWHRSTQKAERGWHEKGPIRSERLCIQHPSHSEHGLDFSMEVAPRSHV